MKIVDVNEISHCDLNAVENKKIPSLLLMEMAANAVYREILPYIKKQDKILIIAGKGNNGGDGFALSRILKINGYDVTLFVKEKPVSQNAKRNYRIAKNIDVKIKKNVKEIEIDRFSVVIDALFGTGFKGELSSFWQNFFTILNNKEIFRIAIDIPSGVSGVLGTASKNAFSAMLTVTFEYPKIGHYLYPGKKLSGKLIVVPIGVSMDNNVFNKEVILKDDIKERKQGFDTNKYRRGVVTVIGGCDKYRGAPVLTASAALNNGAGYVKILSKSKLLNPPLEIVYEMCEDYDKVVLNEKEKESVVVVGPGMGRSEDVPLFLLKIFNEYRGLNIILDADALFFFNKFYKKNIHNVIITPHLGEFSRIINLSVDKIRKNIFELGKNFAIEHNLILILKFETTMIFMPDGRVAINGLGNSHMATLGMGDVLSGILAASLTKNYSLYENVKDAVARHSFVADKLLKDGIINFTAMDVVNEIKKI